MTEHFIVEVANEQHLHFAETICAEMESSAKARGTGIAKRSPDYVQLKIQEGKAVIATTDKGVWAGFCYIESWSHGKYVANSGLIVAPQFRKSGLAREIKQRIFALSREKYPDAKIFGLTTGLAVMKINSDLGYEPVTYSELTQDEAFWSGCKSCINFDILTMKERKNCLCTAMLYDPQEKEEEKVKKPHFDVKKNAVPMERLTNIKRIKFLGNSTKEKINKQLSEKLYIPVVENEEEE